MKAFAVGVLVAVLGFCLANSATAQQKAYWMIMSVEGKTPEGGRLPIDDQVTVLVGPFQEAGSCVVWSAYFEGFFYGYLNSTFRGDCREAVVQHMPGRGTHWVMLPIEENRKITTVMIGPFRDNSVCSRWYTYLEDTLAGRGHSVLRGACRNTAVQY